MVRRGSNCTKAMMVINPNNSTSAVYREKDLRTIGNIAAEYDISVFSDEIYDKVVFDGKFFSMSRLPDDVPRLMNEFSKVNFMSGWRQRYCYFMDRNGIMDEIREEMMRQFRARICANILC